MSRLDRSTTVTTLHPSCQITLELFLGAEVVILDPLSIYEIPRKNGTGRKRQLLKSGGLISFDQDLT